MLRFYCVRNKNKNICVYANVTTEKYGAQRKKKKNLCPLPDSVEKERLKNEKTGPVAMVTRHQLAPASFCSSGVFEPESVRNLRNSYERKTIWTLGKGYLFYKYFSFTVKKKEKTEVSHHIMLRNREDFSGFSVKTFDLLRQNQICYFFL